MLNYKEDVAELHENSLLVELHSDFPVDFINRKRCGESNVLERIWMPSIRKGGVNCSNFIIGGDTKGSGRTMEETLESFYYIKNEISTLEKICIAKSANDIEDNFSRGIISILLGLEGMMPIGTKLTNLQVLYYLGLRIGQLTWNQRNMVADGVSEERSGGGLTTFGVKLIKEMNHLGIIIDISHLSSKGVNDVLEISKKPIICSHSNSFKVCPHPRNIKNEIAIKIAKKGGLIGIVFYPDYVTNHKKPNINHVFDHIDYLVSLIGVDHIGVGADYIHWAPELITGDSNPPDYPEGIKTVEELPNLTKGLIQRGYGKNDVKKILGLNFLRVAKEVCGN